MANLQNQKDDRFAEVLARYDEAVARGGDEAAQAEALQALEGEPERVESFNDALRCLRLLEQAWPRGPGVEGAGDDALGRPAESPKRTVVGGSFDFSGAAASLPVGGALGDFRIVRELGRGGMGVIYEAWQLSLSRKVALKLLRAPAALLTEANRRRFDNETRAAAALDDEHVVKIYAVGREGDTPYFAMQLIEGVSLAEWIAEWRRLARLEAAEQTPTLVRGVAVVEAESLDESPGPSPDSRLTDAISPVPGSAEFHRHVARLGRQACLGLDHAHRHGVIHRDVKPANLLVCKVWRLWVTDFGLARIGGDSDLTLTGDLVGTLRYMSPEQALGKRNVDHRTDVYSLGATLYEMATLSPLFPADDRQALLLSIAQESPVPPRKRAPHIPRDLETIILKATAKAPSERYESAGEFGEDLRRFLNCEPILARRATIADQAAKWVRRNSFTVAATLLTAALLLGALFVMAWTQGRRYRDLADENRLIAKENRDVADENRRAADALRERLYVADIKSTDRAAAKGDARAASEYLDRSLPRPGERDLRGFEWRFLNAQTRRQATTIQASRQTLYFVVHSRDGRRLATAGADAVVRIHDAQTGRVLTEIETGQVEVNGVAFSPDGRTLASAGDDGTVRVWELDSRRELLKIDAHEDKAYQVAISADGAELYSCGSEDPFIRVWNASTGKLINALAGRVPFECLALAPKRRWLAAGDENGELFIFDMAAHQIAVAIRVSMGRIPGLAFSLDEELLTVACARNRCIALSIPGILTLQTIELADPAMDIAVSRNGEHFAVSDRGGSVSLRATRDIRPVDTRRPLLWGQLTADKRAIAYLNDEGVFFHEIDSGKKTPFQPDDQIDWNSQFSRDFAATKAAQGAPPLALSPDGRWFAIGAAIFCADAAHPGGWRKLPNASIDRPAVDQTGAGASAGGANISDLVRQTFTPNGETLARAHGDGRVDFFHLATGEPRNWTEAPRGLGPWSFSPDSRRLAFAEGLVIAQWDVDLHSKTDGRFEHGHDVLALSHSPDGKWLAATDDGGAIVLWPTAGGGPRRIPVDADFAERRDVIIWSADSHFLAIGGKSRSHDGTFNKLRVWNITEDASAPIESYIHEVWWGAFRRDGSLVLGNPGDVTCKLIREAMAPAARPPRWRRHQGRAYGVSFSPTNDRLASVGEDGQLCIWSTSTTNRELLLSIRPPNLHNNWSWFADSKHIAAWDSQSTLYKASAEGGFERWRTVPFGDFWRWAISRDHARFAVRDDRWIIIYGGSPAHEFWRYDYPNQGDGDLEFSPDGRLLAVGGNGNEEILLLDAASGKLVSRLPCPPRIACPPVFSGDGELLAVAASENSEVAIWRLETKERIAQIPGPRHGVKAIALAKRGDWVAGVGADRSLRVWDLATNRERFSAVEHEAPLNALACSPDGRTLVTGDELGVVKLWSAITGEVLLDLTQATGKRIDRIEFSPNGRRLAWSLDGRIEICDVGDP